MKLGSAATEHIRVLWGCRVNAFLLFQDAAPILTNELKGQLETQTTAICCLLLLKEKKKNRAVCIQVSSDAVKLDLQAQVASTQEKFCKALYLQDTSCCPTSSGLLIACPKHLLPALSPLLLHVTTAHPPLLPPLLFLGQHWAPGSRLFQQTSWQGPTGAGSNATAARPAPCSCTYPLHHQPYKNPHLQSGLKCIPSK